MRIISKITDYYDGVVMFSETPVWVRKEHTYTIGKENPYELPRDTIDRLTDAFHSIPSVSMISHHSHLFPYAMVSFCGKLYVVYYMDTFIGRPQDIVSANCPSVFVERWNENTKNEREHITIESDKPYRWYRSRFNDKAFKAWMDLYQNLPVLGDVHRAFKSPVFMVIQKYRDLKITINPILKNVGFQVVIDPWTAFQELERYVGNDLVDTPLDDFSMDDELKRDSKGMDEWSFKQRGPKARKTKT